jgi:hypothetical protein
VEVEDDKGKSVELGQWVKRDDGFWALRIKREDLGALQGAS